MVTPSYNFGTKKIYGCQKGTFAYYHEYRHSIQHKKDLLTKFVMIIRFPYFLLAGYRMGNEGLDVYTIGLLVPVLFFLYLELDAHWFAFKKWKITKHN